MPSWPVSSRARAADLRGINRLTIAGIAGIVDLVEAMHQQIASVPGSLARPPPNRTSGITRLVYRSIHGVIGLVGHGLDRLLAGFEPLLGERSTWRGRETMLAALNGVLGRLPDRFGQSAGDIHAPASAGFSVAAERELLAAAIPQAGGKLLVLVHGLCMNDLLWMRKGHDHGAALARDLGYTPVYLHYNSGLHISTNGRSSPGNSKRWCNGGRCL